MKKYRSGMKPGDKFYNRFIWTIRQLLPLENYTECTIGGQKKVFVWRMWLGRCFSIKEWNVA